MTKNKTASLVAESKELWMRLIFGTGGYTSQWLGYKKCKEREIKESIIYATETNEAGI